MDDPRHKESMERSEGPFHAVYFSSLLSSAHPCAGLSLVCPEQEYLVFISCLASALVGNVSLSVNVWRKRWRKNRGLSVEEEEVAFL